MKAGVPFGLEPGHTSSIRRIEGGMLSYHADMDIMTNPYELGLDRLVDLEMDADFIGKDALRKICQKGVARKQIGLVINGPALKGSNTTFWKVKKGDGIVGKVTSAIYSPRLNQNIALAMVSEDVSEVGTVFDIEMPSGILQARVVEKPFFDPKKMIAVAA